MSELDDQLRTYMDAVRRSTHERRETKPDRRGAARWKVVSIGAAIPIVAILAIVFLIPSGGDEPAPVAGADTTTTLGDTTLETTTTSTDTTTGPSTAPTTSTATAPQDWTEGATWVGFDLDGLRTDISNLVWEPEPVLGETYIVRDGDRGVVFVDAAGLWWFPSDATEPSLVEPDRFGRLIEVVEQDGTRLVHVFDGQSSVFIDLATGATVPFDGSATDPTLEAILNSDNLDVTVEGPTLNDPEDPLGGVTEPAHLVVRNSEDVLVDIRIGTSDKPYARLLDFNGRHIAVAIGPFEPAVADETIYLFDLSCGDCTTTMNAPSVGLAFLDDESDWNGDIEQPMFG